MSLLKPAVIFDKNAKVLWFLKVFIVIVITMKYQYEYGQVRAHSAEKDAVLIAENDSKSETEENKGRAVTKKLCVQLAQTIRARHKTCFLRADTGPCRADIVQWYYDVKQRQCFRFFWGGCQGNGNRFESKTECIHYCHLHLNETGAHHVPKFCSLSFDYGTCFGHYYRWTWDSKEKSCKRRLYSGCGGNQNNFQSREECRANCLSPPRNDLEQAKQLTTCVPFNLE